MSLEVAVAEIDKSIAELSREQERLTKLRNALLAGRPAARVQRTPEVSAPRAVLTKKKKKRKLSPEGRRNILEANKRRWARERKEKKASAAK